jgi:hypothetical protein
MATDTVGPQPSIGMAGYPTAMSPTPCNGPLPASLRIITENIGGGFFNRRLCGSAIIACDTSVPFRHLDIPRLFHSKRRELFVAHRVAKWV